MYEEITSPIIVLLTVASFIMWSALFGYLCRLQPHKSHEWIYREVVMIHAIVMLTLTFACEFLNETWRFTFPGT